MPRLRPANVALLHGAGPRRIGENREVVDAERAEDVSDADGVRVVADNSRESDAGAEGTQHRRDAARAAEPLFTPIRSQQDHWSFLADAFRVAPDVAIKHHIADYDNARLTARDGVLEEYVMRLPALIVL